MNGVKGTNLVQTRLPEKAYLALKKLAEKKGKTVYELTRDVLLTYLIQEGELDYEYATVDVKLKLLEKKIMQLEKQLAELKRKQQARGWFK